MQGVVTVLASAANYMICDDHEFVDDLGEELGEPAHCFCSGLVIRRRTKSNTVRDICKLAVCRAS